MAIYARVDLSKCNYKTLPNCKIIKSPNITELNKIYTKYCRYKKFKSVMPIFDSDYKNNDVIGYYDNDKLVAFSIITMLAFIQLHRHPLKNLAHSGRSSELARSSLYVIHDVCS